MNAKSDKRDVVVVGGGPAGVIAAVTARTYYPEKTVLLIRDRKRVLIPCGIPYILHHLGGDVASDVMPDAPLEKAGVEIMIDEVTALDRDKQVVHTAGGRTIAYERLVLATGSRPVVPPIEGARLSGIYTVAKDDRTQERLVRAAAEAEDIVVVGAGFIGMEVADELASAGRRIHLVEIAPHVLPGAFDEEVARVAAEKLSGRGVRILTGRRVERFIGGERVEKVVLDGGEEIAAQMVILAVGYRPRGELAAAAGLEMTRKGALVVDEFMRTSDAHIFAVGDVAGTVSFLSRKPTSIMLASTAVSEARMAGMNLFSVRVIRPFRGTIAIFSTVIADTAFAAAGVTEQMARSENIAYVVGRGQAPDMHPGKMPGAKTIHVFLKVAASSGVVIGAQMYGGESLGELINVVGLAIEQGLHADELMTSQIGTHPRLTSAPTAYPLIKAAENAVTAMNSR